jgi:hypothetical protein
MRPTTLGALVALAAAAVPAQVASAHDSSQLREVHKATRVFRDVEAAKAAGYKAFNPRVQCP